MVANRIKEFIESQGISVYAFENAIGASRGSISKAIKDNKNIGSNVLENILRVYKELNPEYLLTGNGEMLRVDNQLKEPEATYIKEVSEVDIFKKLLFGDNFEEILNNQDATTDALARLIVNQNKLLDDVADIKSMLAKKKANNN
jgi:transcriptional regulator with XRE-family HTH domain